MLCTLIEHALLSSVKTRYIQIYNKNNYLLQVLTQTTGGTHFWNNQILFSLLLTDLYS